MNREQSTIVKGVAILMMLWYHLFIREDLSTLCTPLFFVGHTPLARLVANASYPVSFFLILSGYGLSHVYRHGHLCAASQLRRLLRLYVVYWIVLLIYVSIGHFLRPDIYIVDLPHLLDNITAFHCTYNGETWFLLPYAFISITSVVTLPLLFSIDSRRKAVGGTIVYAIVFLLVRVIMMRHISDDSQSTLFLLFLQVIYYINNFFYFTLGVVLYRLNEHHGLQLPFISRNWQALLLLLLLAVVKSQFKVTLADGLYALLFIVLFMQLKLSPTVSRMLSCLGRHSTVMWMTHTFFAVYLFPQFVYGFRYPLLIYVVLVAVSYVASFPVMWLHQYLYWGKK